MTRRAPLPMITECVEKQKKKKGVTRTQLLRAAYPFLVICALCLAHVHLQFARVDLLMQQSQLQVQRNVLIRQEQALTRQNEAMCDLEALKIRAIRDMNMQQVEVQTADVFARIPADIKEKYSKPLMPKKADMMVANLRNERQQAGLQEVILSLFDSGRAVAAPSSDRY